MEELLDFILNKARALKSEPVTKRVSSLELKERFDLKLSEHPVASRGELLEILEGIFKYSVNTQNPGFLNQLYGGTHEITWVGEFLASILNTSMATYEIAPLATLMEKELIEAINKEVGFKKAEGLMVPGGSYANMLGVHAARFQKMGKLKETGLYSQDPLHVYVSTEAHYSTEKAMGLLGMGVNQLIKVPVNDKKAMCPKALEKAIEESVSQGAVPLAVVSTAGTTVWGSFDPIESIQNLCDKHQLWHHVDAAWGGLALWAYQKEKFFKGVSKVDSITMDFHKLMASSLTKALFITSKPEVLYGANSGGGTKYIFHNDQGEEHLDTGRYALQCGRKVDSLPLWLQWKLQGSFQYRRKVEELFILRDWALEHIQKDVQKYKLVHHPEFLNLCFQVLPSDETMDVSAFNKKLRQKLLEKGQFMVNFSSQPKEGVFFRLVLSHWGLNLETLKALFKELEFLAYSKGDVQKSEALSRT